jgi:hypothetical protein
MTETKNLHVRLDVNRIYRKLNECGDREFREQLHVFQFGLKHYWKFSTFCSVIDDAVIRVAEQADESGEYVSQLTREELADRINALIDPVLGIGDGK